MIIKTETSDEFIIEEANGIIFEDKKGEQYFVSTGEDYIEIVYGTKEKDHLGDTVLGFVIIKDGKVFVKKEHVNECIR